MKGTTAPVTVGDMPETQLCAAMEWQRKEGIWMSNTAAAKQAKEKLQEFQKLSDY